MSVKNDNIKNQLIASVESSISEMKERMSADILNMELAFLYQNKIYGKEVYGVQNHFADLADDIDSILNEHKSQLHFFYCWFA